MQKLQEFRTRHELEWGYQAPKLKALGKRERGEIIHNQKSNAVADIAAVLAGAGRGNRMWSRDPLLLEAAEVAAEEAAAASRDTEAVEVKEAEAEKETAVEQAAAPSTEGETETPASEAAPAKKSPKAKSKSAAKAPKAKGPLVKANIYWSNDADLRWARKWTENVGHHLGLPSHVKNHRFKTRYMFETPEEREAVNETESTEVTKETEAEQVQAQVQEQEKKQEPEKKRSLFGWLGGKPGSSSADARA